MADEIWPADRDSFGSGDDEECDDMGDLWGSEDPDEVEIEFHSVSDEEFVEDLAREEEEAGPLIAPPA